MQGISEQELQSIYRRLEYARFRPGSVAQRDLGLLANTLKAFQRAEGLEMTGVFDAPTWKKLQQLPDPQRVRIQEITPPETKKTWTLTGPIRLIQYALRELGYEVVMNDTLDEATQKAIAQFQQQYALSVERVLTPPIVFAILDAWCYKGCEQRVFIQPASPTSAAYGAVPMILNGVNWESVVIQGMQKLLMTAGYDPGPPDGRLTQQTQSALRQFQQARQLETSVEFFDQATLLALLGEGCVEGCAWHLFVNTPRPAGIAPSSPHAFEHVLRITASQSAPAEPLNTPRLTPAPSVQIDLQQYPLQVNERAFAVEKFECSDVSGDWVLFYEGLVEKTDANTTLLRLEKRFGYRYHPDKEGINESDWWCIPGRRHCYSKVEFTDWGGKYFQHQTARFPTAQVYQAEIGIINSMYFFLQQACHRNNSRNEE